jgi:hypothetical protein
MQHPTWLTKRQQQQQALQRPMQASQAAVAAAAAAAPPRLSSGCYMLHSRLTVLQQHRYAHLDQFSSIRMAVCCSVIFNVGAASGFGCVEGAGHTQFRRPILCSHVTTGQCLSLVGPVCDRRVMQRPFSGVVS